MTLDAFFCRVVLNRGRFVDQKLLIKKFFAALEVSSVITENFNGFRPARNECS